MVADPLVGPLDRLAPPVGIGMEDAEIDILEAQLAVEIAPVATAVESVIRADVETPLAAPRHEVVGVETLHVGAHLVDPTAQRLRGAVVAPRQVAHSVGTAARLVG